MTITADIRTDRPRHRTLGRVLLAGGVATGVACLVGPRLAESTGLLVLTGAFEYRWPSFLVAVGLFGAAARLLARGAVRRRVLAVCAVAAVAVVWFRMVLFPMLSADWEETGRTAAPDGADRYVVVEEGSAMIDPLWRVSVVDGAGLTARHWNVGTFNGDAADGVLAKVAWSGPDTLVVTSGEGEVTTVRLDPSTGKPERKLSVP
ncbi:hypothetical protein [Streptomyces exfoliatus]|uniref:hypothetical protein n=1 Tax=Streptomyces exfoliatus TaxID=1905 RepID=UPI0004CA1277|nr:hypothetical protein [Streptomyces exfoliatus]